MRYYKVIWGYEPENYIPIEETELEKAIYAHITGKVAVFNEGSINGNRISVISPDINKAMGWNRGYKPEAEDFKEFEAKKGKEYTGYLAEVKNKVNYLVQNRKEELIGKNVDIKLLK